MARHMLAMEGPATPSPGACAAAAERVYDRLDLHLAALLGTAGVRALFVRTAMLRRLAPATLESSTGLREHLTSLDPARRRVAAEDLFATFLALVSTFIGDRLTEEVLRRAWPTSHLPPPREEES